MGIEVVCRHCGQASVVEDRFAGGRIQCQFCFVETEVPPAGPGMAAPLPSDAPPVQPPWTAMAGGPFQPPALSGMDRLNMDRCRKLVKGLRCFQAGLIQLAAMMGVVFIFIMSKYTQDTSPGSFAEGLDATFGRIVVAGCVMGLLGVSGWICSIVGCFISSSGSAGRPGAALGTWAGIFLLSPIILFFVGFLGVASHNSGALEGLTIMAVLVALMMLAGPVLVILFLRRTCLNFGRVPLAQQCTFLLVGLLAIFVANLVVRFASFTIHDPTTGIIIGLASTAAQVGLVLWLFLIIRNLTDHLKRLNAASLRNPEVPPPMQPIEWMQRGL